MKKFHIITTIVLMSLISWGGGVMASADEAFAPNVHPTTGTISVPADYTL